MIPLTAQAVRQKGECCLIITFELQIMTKVLAAILDFSITNLVDRDIVNLSMHAFSFEFHL